MITLTIKRQDGSTYWTAYFNSQADCDTWLATEKTRPYWNAAWTTAIVEITPPPPPDTTTLEYRIAEVYRKRQAEYPSADALVVALMEAQFEGKAQALQDLQTQRLAVKAKYPKPTA